MSGAIHAEESATSSVSEPPRSTAVRPSASTAFWHVPDWAHPRSDTEGPGRGWRARYRARVIITTVGPYQLYGPELVKACAERQRVVRAAATIDEQALLQQVTQNLR